MEIDLRHRLLGAVALFGVAACGQPPQKIQSPAGERRELVDTSGAWATEPELCRARPWLISESALVTGDGVACRLVQRRPGATGWSSQLVCPNASAASVTAIYSPGAPDSLVLTGGAFPSEVRLLRCASGASSQPARDPHQPIETARAIDRQIVTQPREFEAVRFSDANASIKAAWLRDGVPVKIVEPIVGGASAPGERRYYFGGANADLMLVEDATGRFVFEKGVLVIRYSARGGVLPQTDAPEVQDRAAQLLQQAMVLKRMAQPGPG